MTESLRDRIARHEGFRSRPYKDSLGFLTIGYGRCLDIKGISQDEGLYLLDDDIGEATDELIGALGWTEQLDAVRRGVLVEMVFQLGLGGVLAFKHMLAAAQQGVWDRAADEMLSSEWAKQTPARAQELANIMRTGTDQ
jgi:lysozyme